VPSEPARPEPTDTTPQPGEAPGELGTGAGEAGAGGLAGAPNMFVDQLAAQVRGPLTATLPSGQTFVLTRGQPIPLQFNQPGTRFNFDVILPDGTRLLAGQPLPSGLLPIVGILPLESGRGNGPLALVARGAFKIAENESPKPQDRVFVNYWYFQDVNGTFNFGPRTDVHREVFGFERTFLDGDASIGLRVPVIQVLGDVGIENYDLGDLTFILKFALINDESTGNVFSTGLVLTVPTGASFLPAGVPDVHPFLFQPYVGGIYNIGDLYLIGFSSIVVPTDSRDVTFLSNDLGIGYYLLRRDDGFLTSIVPTVEMHLLTPLNHRGAQTEPVGLQDQLNLTFGTRFGLGRRANLGLGLVTPVLGPRPFDFEAQVQFNLRF
jgi:hypothetical protein